MSIIKSVEEALNLFHNKGFFGDLIYNLAMHNNNPFEFFYTLSEIARKSHFDFHRYQLHEVFILIENYIKHMNNSSPLIDMLRLHYLKRAKVKPHLYFDVEKDKQAKKTLFEPLAIKYNLSINDLFKHSVVYNNHIIYYHNHQAISL
jgi:hypothetical protein